MLKIRKSTNAADRLGEIRRQIKELEKQEEAIRAELIEAGIARLKGAQYLVTLSRYEKESTNWRGIAEKLGASRQMIAANTTTKAVFQVSCSELD
jgi:hypothetical protein